MSWPRLIAGMLRRWLVPPGIPMGRVQPHRMDDLNRSRNHNDPSTNYGRTLR